MKGNAFDEIKVWVLMFYLQGDRELEGKHKMISTNRLNVKVNFKKRQSHTDW